MFSRDKPLPNPPVPPKPSTLSSPGGGNSGKSGKQLVFNFTGGASRPPPLPPHGSRNNCSQPSRVRRDENENIQVSLSASDVKKGTSPMSSAIAKFGPTVVKLNQQYQNHQAAQGTSPKKFPPAPPGQKPTVVTPSKSKTEIASVLANRYLSGNRWSDDEDTQESKPKPTVIVPSKHTVSVAKKIFETKLPETSQPTVIRPGPPAPSAKPKWGSVPKSSSESSFQNFQQQQFQPPTIVRPNREHETACDKEPQSDHASVQTLRNRLQKELHFGTPPTAIVRPHRPEPLEIDTRTTKDIPMRPDPPSPKKPQRPLSPIKKQPHRPPPPKISPSAPQLSEPHAAVTYDFAGEEYDELSSSMGDTILLKREVDAEWIYGHNSRTGRNGIIPKSFLNVLVPLAPPVSLHSTVNGNGGHSANTNTKNRLPPQQLSPRLEDSGLDFYGQGPRVYTLHEYKSSQPGDLTFFQGESIKLLNKINVDWLEGESSDGRKGIFPASFVQIIEDLPELVPNTSSYSAGNSPRKESRGFNNREADNVVRAVYAYSGETADDLRFQSEERIHVSGKISDDWLYGNLVSDPGKSGMFPATFVVGIPPGLPTMDLSSGHEQESCSQQDSGDVGKIAEVLYDYHSENQGDLYVTAGDKICITGIEGPDWLRGKIVGARTIPEGFCPRNFVQIS